MPSNDIRWPPRVECVWDAQAQLGEGPIWHMERQSVFWVDIVSSSLHEYVPSTQVRHVWHLPGTLSCIAPSVAGGFVGTFANGIHHIDLSSSELNLLHDPEPLLPNNRLNDGCCDRDGNLWFGSMDNLESVASGAIYRLQPNGACERMTGDFVISNGPAFSPSGNTIYFTDTLARRIYSAELDSGELAYATIEDAQVFAEFTESDGYPDGIAVDAQGYLWCAMFAGAKIVRLTPSGDRDRDLPMPVPNITKCCFGGEKLQTLFITTAAKAMSPTQRRECPQAGGLFTVSLDVQGLPTALFGHVEDQQARTK